MASVVLVTGVGRHLGARVATRLSAESSIERIIGVDTVPPRPRAARMGRTEYVRADIGHPLIGKVLDQARVDTVVHTRVRDARDVATISLLAACERSSTVTRVVVESATAVYGAGRREPAVVTEDRPPGGRGHVREGHLRSFARRRPDIAVSVLRLADLIGPGIDTWFTRYLAAVLVPTPFGFDPRLQLLHDADAVDVFAQACIERHPGVTNVAADGVITLAQAVRWAGGLRVPVPVPALSALRVDAGLLQYGRVVDTTRLKTRFGFLPRYSTAEALHTFLEHRTALPHPAIAAVAAAQRLVRG